VIEGKRFVLIGGASMIGSHIVDRLIRAGAGSVVVFDDFSRGTLDNLHESIDDRRLEVLKGDVRDLPAVHAVVDGADTVFHLAAIRINRCEQEPRQAFEILAAGMFNVIESAADSGIGKIIFSSSASVYGQADRFPTDEFAHPYGNRTIYGALKLFGEGMLRSFNEMKGLDYVALRYFNVYGPRMDTEGKYTEVLIRWMGRIASGQKPILHGDGSQALDLVFVDDVARANVLAAASDATDVAINIGTGVPVTLLELAQALCRVMGAAEDVEFQPSDRATQVQFRQADTTLARKLLGFETEVGLEEGLDRLVRWWRAQPSGRGA
jgi:nucleoside-diphosphate-sugar epimerase